MGDFIGDFHNTFRTARINAERSLGFLPFRAFIKFGALVQEQKNWGTGNFPNIDFVGADGIPNTADDSLAPYVDKGFTIRDPGAGNIPTVN